MESDTKYIIIIADGMADEPTVALSGKTPLQVAQTPYMDRLAQEGRSGRLKTVPDGLPPGSETAILSIMGYDVRSVYQGRAALEAAGMGVVLQPGELALRCNLVTLEKGVMKDYSAGHISNEDAGVLIGDLNSALEEDGVQLHAGLSFRNLLTVTGGSDKIVCTPPHNIHGEAWRSHLAKSASEEGRLTAEKLNQLVLWSQTILSAHPVNRRRVSAGKLPANSIWLWSPGYQPRLEPFDKLWPVVKATMITAVDLVRGIARYAGLELIEVGGATGFYDTNYEGKTEAAIQALERNDLVFLHIEASDEASHEGDVALKIKTIEDLDSRVVRPIYEWMQTGDKPIILALLPDHPTPCTKRTHTADPVPFVLYGKMITPDHVMQYDETSAREGDEGLIEGKALLQKLLNYGKNGK